MSDSQWNYRPARQRAGWTIGLIAASVIGEILISLTDVAGTLIYATWNDPNADLTDSGELVLALILAGAGLLTLGAFIAAAVMFCCWMYRACANTHALGAQGMKTTPGWAVGWWFIPIANLFKPFGAMKEIYLASDPDAGPSDWHNRGTPAILGWWWAAWLIGNFVGQAEFRISMRSTDPAVLEALVWVGLASTAISAIAAGLVIRIILDVQRNQALKSAGHRDANRRVCPRCQYDLRGTSGPFCPECGCTLPVRGVIRP